MIMIEISYNMSNPLGHHKLAIHLFLGEIIILDIRME